MCRHLAWLGAPRSLASLVLEPEYGLLRQSYQPRRQARGLLNADGWGVGFFTDDDPAPARWRSAKPLWSDASFASVAPRISSGAGLAAVRSATVGMPPDETAAAPFTDGTWLLSHNGRVDRRALGHQPEAESVCDSAVLAALVLTEGVDRLLDTVAKVAGADPGAYLNLLLTDGRRILGLTWGDPAAYLHVPDGSAGDRPPGVVVASEPYDDDPAWVDVPDRHLIEATPTGVAVTPLEDLLHDQ